LHPFHAEQAPKRTPIRRRTSPTGRRPPRPASRGKTTEQRWTCQVRHRRRRPRMPL
jgi:hypothetical protein